MPGPDPVILDAEIWDDWRFSALAELAGYSNEFEAVGRIAKLWAAASARRTRVMPIPAIRVFMGPNGPAAMLEVGLGTVHDNGIYLEGSSRFEKWWAKRDQRSEASVPGGKARSAQAKRDGGKFVTQTTDHQHPTSIEPADHQPTDQRKPASGICSLPEERETSARAIPAPPDPAQDSEPTPPGTLPVPASAAQRRHALRRVEQDHSERYQRVRSVLGAQVPALNLTGEGERWLVDALKTRGDTAAALEQAVADCQHVLVVREAQAVKSGSMRYFGATVWKPDEFAWALQRTPADFDRGRSRDGPASPSEPKRRPIKQL